MSVILFTREGGVVSLVFSRGGWVYLVPVPFWGGYVWGVARGWALPTPDMGYNGIWSAIGRYASYLNAFLLLFIFINVLPISKGKKINPVTHNYVIIYLEFMPKYGNFFALNYLMFKILDIILITKVKFEKYVQHLPLLNI